MAEAGAIGGMALSGSDALPLVGPNAINRIAEALIAAHGAAKAQDVFASAGLAGWLHEQPGTMIPENDVAALHRALFASLGGPEARAIAGEAGHRAARHLLAHRIKGPVRLALTLLPPEPSARILLGIIRRHAWTFVGSGQYEARATPPVTVSITGGALRAAGPAASGVAAYYAATFEGLFRVVVHPRAHAAALKRATETCASCSFSLTW